MAHHIGMSFVALTNALLSHPGSGASTPIGCAGGRAAAAERVPRRLVLQEPQSAPAEQSLPDPEMQRPAVRGIDSADTSQPRIALLGSLPYTMMVSNGGGGYSRYEDLAVTRWRADGTADNTGQFCYVKESRRNRVVGRPPAGVCARRLVSRLAGHRPRDALPHAMATSTHEPRSSSCPRIRPKSAGSP